MSQSANKLIMSCKIELSDELKAALDDARKDAAQTRATVELWHRQAEREAGKHRRAGGGLLAAMDAANDASESELKQLGQWVFAGCDPRIKSASVDSDGEAARWGCDKNELDLFEGQFVSPARVLYEAIEGKFDTTNWRNSAINRQPVNDVDYLTDSDSEHDIAPTLAVADDMQSLSKNDLQGVFIKNMSNLLIQRMHSMDRFSDNDYEIDADQLMPWDVIYDMGADRFGFVTASQKEHIAAYFLKPLSVHSDYGSGACFHRSSLLGKALRTITEDEVMNFCCVLEAYHA